MAAMRIEHGCLIVALAVGGCGAESAGRGKTTAVEPPAQTAPAAPAEGAWLAGEATISVKDIKAHVYELADDRYEGRDTFSPGLAMAADYISQQFASYGLEPLPGRDSYLVDYTLERKGWDASETLLQLRRGKSVIDLEPGVQFEPISQLTDEARISGPVVFAGYGLHLPDKGWDDYKSLDVKGKIVLVLRHIPNEQERAARAKELAEKARAAGQPVKEDPKAITSRDGAFASKAKAAHDRGAIGMIVVTEPSHENDETFSLMGRPYVPKEKTSSGEVAKVAKQPADQKDAGGKAATAPEQGKGKAKGKAKPKKPFVSVLMARDVVDQLLSETELNLAALQAQVDKGKKPRALGLGKVTATISAKSGTEPEKVQADNVVGFLPGSDPTMRDQWVVIGGHYDHVGTGGLDGDRIHNGADDNASGTSAVLELAQAFASLDPAARPRRSIVFAAFSAEELGLLGSHAMLEESDLPIDKLVFMLNLDMLGRNEDQPIEILGDAFATGVKDATEAANRDLDLNIEWAGLNYSASSDHHPFHVRGVPSMFFFTGTHEDYHQPGDHADKLSYPRIEKLTKLGYRLTGAVASGQLTPQYLHQLLWMGISVKVENGAATVLTVDGKSRGARAGLLAGDVVAKIAGKSIASSRQLSDALLAIEPGSMAPVEIERGGKTVTVEIERAKPGYMGVYPGPVSEETRQQFALAEDQGLTIASVLEGGPSDRSGLKAGDIVIAMGGQPVGGRTLFRRLATLGAGETALLEVIRDGKRIKLELTLGERPNN